MFPVLTDTKRGIEPVIEGNSTYKTLLVKETLSLSDSVPGKNLKIYTFLSFAFVNEFRERKVSLFYAL